MSVPVVTKWVPGWTLKRKAVARAKHQLRALELRHARPRRIKRAKARLEKRVAAEAKRPKKVRVW